MDIKPVIVLSQKETKSIIKDWAENNGYNVETVSFVMDYDYLEGVRIVTLPKKIKEYN